VRDAAQRALLAVRGGGGPAFLELRSYRFRAHSMFDPELYRDKAEVERWKLRDPIERLREALASEGRLEEADWQRLEAVVAGEIQAAVDFAEAAEWEPVEDLLRFVTSERGPKPPVSR
jgi:TPP-dependent pyruvate/acetoin dehydrogenase alpha subunit